MIFVELEKVSEGSLYIDLTPVGYPNLAMHEWISKESTDKVIGILYELFLSGF